MRIYQSSYEMVREVERELAEMGISYQTETVQDKHVADDPDFMTKELVGYVYQLTRYNDLEKMLSYLNMPVNWVEAEIAERLTLSLTNKNPGTAWTEREEFWNEYLRNDVFSYSYAERYHWQIPYIIRELIYKPNTRQAMLMMYSAERDIMSWGGQDRTPCSISYQFIRRGDQLDIIYNQRSCDFINFFASDVAITIELLKYIAAEVGVKPGFFIHMIGSLHAFAKDLKGVF